MLATVDHAHVAHDEARRGAIVNAQETAALEAALERYVAELQGAEHHLIRRRYGLLLENGVHEQRLRSLGPPPRAERRQAA